MAPPPVTSLSCARFPACRNFLPRLGEQARCCLACALKPRGVQEPPPGTRCRRRAGAAAGSVHQRMPNAACTRPGVGTSWPGRGAATGRVCRRRSWGDRAAGASGGTLNKSVWRQLCCGCASSQAFLPRPCAQGCGRERGSLSPGASSPTCCGTGRGLGDAGARCSSLSEGTGKLWIRQRGVMAGLERGCCSPRLSPCPLLGDGGHSGFSGGRGRARVLAGEEPV